MSYAQHTIQSYQTAQISTADRGEVLLLVFDGALRIAFPGGHAVARPAPAFQNAGEALAGGGDDI